MREGLEKIRENMGGQMMVERTVSRQITLEAAQTCLYVTLTSSYGINELK